MKITKSNLSLLLVITILFSMVVSATSVSAAEPEILLELDFSNFTAVQAAPSATPNPSRITASGEWGSDTGISFAEREPKTNPDYNKITKESFQNANNDTTYYIKFYDPAIYPNLPPPATNSWIAHKKNTYITNAALESRDNTISMWLDATACGYDASASVPGFWKDILCYRVDYNDGSKNVVETLDLGINPDGKWNAVSAPRKFSESTPIMEYPTGAFDVSEGWKHVVITNPKAENGKKVMDVYVNGLLEQSVTLDVNGTVSHATMHFFGNSAINDEYWISRNDIIPEALLGGLRVYGGVMSAQEIADLYSAQLPEFTDANALKNIVGYSFDDATVKYDGASHNIKVTEASGATEDVDITYTCDNKDFEGATEAGTYYITATITKDGYHPLILSAKLKITKTDLLIDLDFSTYVKDTSSTDPNTVAGSVGSVTNNGLLEDSTVLKFRPHHNRWSSDTLTLEEIENALGSTTYYLHKTVGLHYCTDSNRFATIIEKGLEEQANTISFWANYVPVNITGAQWNILDYSAQYGGTSKVLFSLNQAGTTENKFHLVGRGETPYYADLTDIGVRKWAHYVVTNPEYTLNTETGEYEKTMSVYVNGVLRGSKTVTKPDGTLDTVKIAFAGEAVNPGAGRNWPTNISFGGVKVYAGDLDSSEIRDKYNSERLLYEPVIKFVNDKGEEINKFADLSEVTLKYTSGSDKAATCYVAFYDKDKNFILAKTMESGANTLTIKIPDETDTIKGFAWDWKDNTILPLVKACVLNKE